MALLTINIPDPIANRVIDAFCSQHGWISIPISGTKVSFTKKILIDYIKTTVKRVEGEDAAGAARAAAEAAVETDIALM